MMLRTTNENSLKIRTCYYGVHGSLRSKLCPVAGGVRQPTHFPQQYVVILFFIIVEELVDG